MFTFVVPMATFTDPDTGDTLTLSAAGLLSFPSTPGHHYDIEMCQQLGASAEWNVIHRLQATGSLTTHNLSAHMTTGRQAFLRVKDTTP